MTENEKPLTHAAKAPDGRTNWSCECPNGGDHWIGPLDAEVLEKFATTPGGAERLSVAGEVFAVRIGLEGPWTCGVSSRIGCWPLANDKKLPTEFRFTQSRHTDGLLPGDAPATTRLEHRDWSSTPRTGKAAEQEVWKLQEQLTDTFVNNAMRIHVQHREQEWREMIQAAMKLVEENPRNEPMRIEISRPAVERMLAKDLDDLGYETVDEMAKKLFDLGWRPTIDRLVR